MSRNKKKVTQAIYDILNERCMPPYPDAAKAAGIGYTDYLTCAGAQAKGVSFSKDPKTGEEYVYTPARNRQCSIGYHGECTNPEGVTCGCPCHPLVALLTEENEG